MPQNNYITVTLRSHIVPSDCIVEDFKIGKSFAINVHSNVTLEELTQKLFPHNKDHIGFIVVNGQLALQNKVLHQGDTVYIYSQVSGG